MTAGRLRVVVADDDAFVASLVAAGLRAHGFAVATAHTTAEAWKLVSESEPHAVVSDLNFGPGESAAPMLTRVRSSYPWIGLVVLTSHLSPALAVGDSSAMPLDVVYLVKTQLNEVSDIRDAVMRAISGAPETRGTDGQAAEVATLTRSQAEVLRLLADGASTRAIAESRGTSVRAAETMLARLYTALEIDTDDAVNSRVAAVRLWQQGRVSVK